MKPWRSVGILAFVVIGLTAEQAVAAPNAPPDRGWLRTAAKAEPKQPNRSDLSLGKWAAVAILVGLGATLVWKRRTTPRGVTTTSVSKMKILAVTRLSAKAQIVAVEIQGRTLLVGSTDTSVTRLGWLEEPEPNLDDDQEDEERPPPTYERPQPLAQGRSPLSRLTGNAAAPTRPIASKPKGTAKTPAPPASPSRFRELLADAIGIEPRKAPRATLPDSAASDEIAARTEDRYVGRSPQRTNTQKITRSVPKTTALIDVEGQAKGLLARLNRPGP